MTLECRRGFWWLRPNLVNDTSRFESGMNGRLLSMINRYMHRSLKFFSARAIPISQGDMPRRELRHS
jgi:hypothetical protein